MIWVPFKLSFILNYLVATDFWLKRQCVLRSVLVYILIVACRIQVSVAFGADQESNNNPKDYGNLIK